MSRRYQTLLHALVADAVEGKLPAGTKLPSEIELGRGFGLSRGVVRECIRSREERGLVSVKHGSGRTADGPQAEERFHAADVAFHGAPPVTPCSTTSA